MSDSDSDDSTSNQSEPSVKRARFGDHNAAASYTAYQESAPSDDNETGNSDQGYDTRLPRLSKVGNDLRLSQSSASEACSSPGEDYRPAFDLKDDKSSNEDDNAYSGKYGDTAMRMMSNMGYKKGKGLGKNESGRTEPVLASTQKGRLGLGHKPSTLGDVPADFKWSPDDSTPQAEEEVLWMPKPPDEEVTADLLEDWLIKGPKKLTLEDETEFCQESILNGVLSAKNVFDSLEGEEMRNARTRSNPYEKIGSLFFLNRAAVKMANIDAILGFMFTNPRDLHGNPLVKENELLFFADVCAGPGGFSEYVLHRKRWKAKGFGFTLRGANDFKLSDFYAGPPETFSPYYGPNDDGDIYSPVNLNALRDYVLKQTDDKGVHFLMADGGFSVDGQENVQEILSKQLYLCQCLAGLMLVRTGGHFVVKLFDLFTPFSVSLVYLMYRSYYKVSIHKPVTSRPANSERYLIGLHKRAESDVIERHLFKVNEYLCSQKDKGGDVVSLVPVDDMRDDGQFFDYVYRSNCVLGEKQIKNLLKIKKYCQDKSLHEPLQNKIRSECIKLWKLKDDLRTKPQRMNCDETLSEIMRLMKKRPRNATDLNAFKAGLVEKRKQFTEIADLKAFSSIYNVNFEILSSPRDSQCRFFIGTGSNQTHELVDRVWKHEGQLNLPAKTLVYGEIIKEFSGEGMNQVNKRALHIVDAICLGEVDVSYKPISERLRECELFCRALYKPDDTVLRPIRCKRLHELSEFPEVMSCLSVRKMKNTPPALTVDINSRLESREWFHVVGSLVFFKNVKEPWESHMSRTKNSKYYFTIDKQGKITSASVHELPEEGWLDVLSSLEGRLEWAWSPASAVFNGDHSGVTRRDVEEYVERKRNK